MRKQADNGFPKWVAWGGAVAGALALYYIIAGAGSDQDAAAIPNSIEQKLDRVVDALNSRLGKAWVDRGLGYVQSALSGVLPPALVGLVGAVYRAEVWARNQRANGLSVTGFQ